MYLFSKEIVEQDRIRLTNQLWKLIPMWENGEDWESHLDNVLTEIMGLIKIFSLNELVLISKLIGLKEKLNQGQLHISMKILKYWQMKPLMNVRLKLYSREK